MLGDPYYPSPPCTLTISFSDVKGGQASVYVETGSSINWGSGMISDDPLFMEGPLGDHYLSQVAAGQGSNSPCVDTGDPSSEMIEGTTRTDEAQDDGIVDMGYHYPLPSENEHVVVRFGNVNESILPITDVFFINDSIGDDNRVLTVSPVEDLTFRMGPPPAGPLWASFTLYAFIGEAVQSNLNALPYEIGTFCFPTPLNEASPPQVFTIANNFGHYDILGYPYIQTETTPTTFLTIPAGTLPPATTLTFQGLIDDAGSSGPGISITNAIVLKVQ